MLSAKVKPCGAGNMARFPNTGEEVSSYMATTQWEFCNVAIAMSVVHELVVVLYCWV